MDPTRIRLECPVDERGYQRRPFRCSSRTGSSPLPFPKPLRPSPHPLLLPSPLDSELNSSSTTSPGLPSKVSTAALSQTASSLARAQPSLSFTSSRKDPPDLNPPSSSVPLSRKNPSSMWDSTLKITLRTSASTE